jgi:hypothetical protein
MLGCQGWPRVEFIGFSAMMAPSPLEKRRSGWGSGKLRLVWYYTDRLFFIQIIHYLAYIVLYSYVSLL